MLSQESVDDYLAKYKKRGARVVERLARLHSCKEALESKIGEEIFKFIIPEMEDLLDKVIDLEASNEEKIRFSVYKDFSTRILKTVSEYDTVVKSIKEMKLP